VEVGARKERGGDKRNMIEVTEGMGYIEAMLALEAQATEEVVVSGSIFSTLGVLVVEGMSYVEAVMAMLL